ncbi:MAG TPA: hypothetical protein VIY56_00930, partial [Vicinamibacterales bacterium]
MEIGKGTLGIVAAIGIAAGATGALLAGRVWEPARQAVPGLEAQGVDAQPAADLPSAVSLPSPEAPAPVRTTRPVARPATSRTTSRNPPVEAVAPPRTTSSAPEPGPSPVIEPRPADPAPAVEAVPTAVPEREPEVVAAVEEPRYEDLVLPAQGVIGIQLDRSVSSETARVEDEVIGHVTRDVRVGDRVAIPAGSRATGVVTLAERGGRLKDRARLGVRFTS